MLRKRNHRDIVIFCDCDLLRQLERIYENLHAQMGSLSLSTANIILWLVYLTTFILASGIAYWKRSKNKNFFSTTRVQSGLSLALNFSASGLGCTILTTYPQVANIDGIQGLLVYALAGGLPMFLFAFVGPLIVKKCPEGFVLTEWVISRYGIVCGRYLSVCTIITSCLFIVSELASLKYAIEYLTDMKALPLIILECTITTIYTSIGGFHVSFFTDILQVIIIFILSLIMAYDLAFYIKIDSELLLESGLLNFDARAWQLVYILGVATFTNYFFMSGFGIRTFSARSQRDLMIGCYLGAIILVAFVTIIGASGMVAVWAGYMPVADQGNSGAAFFLILERLPTSIIGFVLSFVIVLSTCTIDSLQSALVSTISNDIFRNRIHIFWSRLVVVLIMVPVVVLSLHAEDILNIYLMLDILSSSVVPVLMLGLSSKFDFFTAWEVIGGGLGGLFAVWMFGTIYYCSPIKGIRLLLMWNGLYPNDYSVFGAFVLAPLGGLASGFMIFFIRSALLYIQDRMKNLKFKIYTKKFIYEYEVAFEINRKSYASIVNEAP